MRNKIEFSADPAEIFANPWRTPGITLAAPPSFIWREAPAARIAGFGASAHPAISRRIGEVVTHTQRHRQMPRAFVFNAQPMIVEDLNIRKSHAFVGERALLKGASGTRLINQYRWEDPGLRDARTAALDTFFAECRMQNAGAVLRVGVPPEYVPIVIECRNTFNFFHFITESLAQLTLFDGLSEGREIVFHYPHSDDKHRAFTEGFADALFPELVGRIRFSRAPAQYNMALTGYDMLSAVSQMPLDPELTGMMGQDAAPGTVDFQPTLAMNSVSETILRLRARGLKAVAAHTGDLPRRIYVGRRDDHARARPVAGEARLLEHLALFGFETIAFEDYSPLDQIALMAGAEIVIAPHGAGLTHMMFARSDCHVIELGTLQTAQHRWADFWPLAHAAQCRFVSFFADFNSQNPSIEPDFSEDGLVPTALSDAAIAQILSYVVCVLGHVPDLPSADAVQSLAQRLLRMDLPDRALALLDAHKHLTEASGALCLTLADCHKALDSPKSELLALDRAFKLDPDRWQTLVRIIWCANRVERPQVIRWALSRLERDFPDRHDAFVANHAWVRYVA
ncbi:glycosyltransferase family 61 protein [Sulfitobacter albidus]|uniref:Glycosyltransferase family 61 protein n=1 Tax=Sulfitobacter albidus TaxID=2829501 RepID=A0A975PM95_9RHOB|nr:glycosyltransferase family 61 protein [Sulfitobacter albidus]QUJ76191.1 glycosyltransferase family 61 protein [Sulfitobacter albidus]